MKRIIIELTKKKISKEQFHLMQNAFVVIVVVVFEVVSYISMSFN
jgi:hypothetical protein